MLTSSDGVCVCVLIPLAFPVRSHEEDMTKRKKVDIHEHFQRERQSRSGTELNGLIIIREYGSTLYVGMTRVKNGGRIKRVH